MRIQVSQIADTGCIVLVFGTKRFFIDLYGLKKIGFRLFVPALSSVQDSLLTQYKGIVLMSLAQERRS